MTPTASTYFPTDAISVPIKEDLKLACLLGALAALATAALFPYLMVVMPQALGTLPMPIWAVVLAQSAQAGLLLTLLSFFGLRMGHYVELDAAWFRGLLFRRERPAQPWLKAIAFGTVAGLLIVGIDSLFTPYMPALLNPEAAPTPQASSATGFLASFYGAIGEELQLRLFLMTLLVWALSKVSGGRLKPQVFWIAIILAALIFGVAHLPAAARMWPLDLVVYSKIVLLNGIGGVVFGWLYWKHGLESAMVAHFSADLILHVVAPLAAG